MTVVDDFSYREKVQISIALDEHRFVSSGGEDLAELLLNFTFFQGSLIDLVDYAVPTVGKELNHNCLRQI